MRPGDHPDFFRFAPPPGTSRESAIRLDRDGRFWHEGARVDHPALERALRSWIARHPDDGRPILSNGYDWCYFQVDDTPLFVDAIRVGEGGAVTLTLFDGAEEPLDPATLAVDADGVVVARARGGLEARFTRHAQTQLAPLLVEAEPPTLCIGGRDIVVPPRARPPEPPSSGR